MTEQEKMKNVIKALECCTKKVCIYNDTEKECPYWELCGEYEDAFEDCTTALAKDALALLKAQEPVMMVGTELTDTELIEKIWKAPIIMKPIVDAAPVVHGEWIEVATDIVCTNCKAAYDADVANLYRGEQDLKHYGGFEHCPHCGAKMDGERRDSE